MLNQWRARPARTHPASVAQSAERASDRDRTASREARAATSRCVYSFLAKVVY